MKLFAFLVMMFSIFMVWYVWNSPSPQTREHHECIERKNQEVWTGKFVVKQSICVRYQEIGK